MRRLAFSDDAVEFDGKIIGYTRVRNLGYIYAYTPDDSESKLFGTVERAHAWLVERYVKTQEGDGDANR